MLWNFLKPDYYCKILEPRVENKNHQIRYYSEFHLWNIHGMSAKKSGRE